MPKIVLPRPQLWTILLLILVTGCSSGDDERLVEFGQQACDRQSQQNQTIADQSRQVTETTHEFVESSGDARKEMIDLQRELVEAEAEARNELVRIQQDLVDRDAECRQELNAVLPKNSIRRLYQPTGHTSNWVMTEKMATKKHGIPRESGCFTITRRPVAANQPGKPMFTITQRGCTDDAIRRPAGVQRPYPRQAAQRDVGSASCDPAKDGIWNCDSSRSIRSGCDVDVFR